MLQREASFKLILVSYWLFDSYYFGLRKLFHFLPLLAH